MNLILCLHHNKTHTQRLGVKLSGNVPSMCEALGSSPPPKPSEPQNQANPKCEQESWSAMEGVGKRQGCWLLEE
jgi:hypothetical protein